MSGIAILKRLLMKQAMKKSAGSSGIMSLNKNLVKDVDDTVKKWIVSAKRQGQDIDKMGEQEIKYIVELNKKPKISVISQDDARFKELTEKLGLNDPKKNKFLRKKSEVVDLTGKTIHPGEKIMGGIKDVVDVVTDTVTKIKTMEPVAAMKEANLVISRKGKYKNLTKEQSQKILKDTDDWIFQRDPDDLYNYDKKRPFRDDFDPEDFAYGGVAGLLGEPTYEDENHRVPYQTGLKVYPKASVRIGEQGLGNDFGLGTKDTTYGGTLIGEKDGLYGGIDYLKIKNKIDFMKENQTLFKDTTDDEKMDFIFGKKGDNYDIRFKTDKDFDNKQVTWNWKLNEGGRVPFKKGHSAGRRNFLKGIAALATVPIIGKYFKWAKPLAKSSKVLTSVPIKSGADGMPLWFKPLVNKVIKEGDNVTKKFATAEREIVHKTKLPDSQTDVVVTQNLDNGDVVVDIGLTKHGFRDGHLGQPVRLEYKAAEVLEPTHVQNIKKGSRFEKTGKPTKTKEEFWVEEAEFSGGHPENVKFEESTFEKFGQHGSNFDEVEKFATGKIKKIKPTKKKVQTEFESGKAEADADRWADDLDMASGGRVPMWLGGGLTKGKRTLAELLKYMSKGSSHGKTPSEMLKMINPKQFNEMLDRPEGIPSIAKEMIEKYTKEMKIDRASMIEDLIGTGRKIKKVDDGLVNYKIKIVEDMVSKGVDRKTAVQMADNIAEMVSSAAGKKVTPKITDQGLLEMENIQKNLATKDRKLNASGGLAGMLGE